MTPPSTQALLTALRDDRQEAARVDYADLERLWANLEPAGLEEVLGVWQGRVIRTGHPVERLLDGSGWYGKTFNSPMDAKPLICRDGAGELYSNVELGGGEATLWMVEFRGECTASMVYDGRPIVDHFKKVDRDTLLGVMNGRDTLHEGKHCYFLLIRD
ncbi:DUF4334 domain-containing protein [Salinactinospora qingdaonensis]|uniref:DUF4334 domain-containing protein n=1 Tax=Salinactinospora qingdaonensis TaxID=702744 RepID=A0ABP7G2Y0_9ACTN